VVNCREYAVSSSSAVLWHLANAEQVAIVLALGMPADIYLIDEPSACRLLFRSPLWRCYVTCLLTL
jgi:hypothetical protein